MPLIYVQRFGTVITVGGTQYINGALVFNGNTEIELDPAVFTTAGTYTLFDYSAGSFAGGQAQLDTYVTVDASSLIGLSVVMATTSGLTDDAVNKRITVTLS